MSHIDFLRELEQGKLRTARAIDGQWQVDATVKARILDVFRNSKAKSMPGGFRDKAPLVPQVFSDEKNIRVVPGGTAVRAGAHVGQNVVIMPPAYVNIGAYIDDNTMIDSHVLVGSCAQIGKRVHLSAAVQIGGVLEPIGQTPVIVEDDCFIGAGIVITEGIIVRKGAVLAPGLNLSAAVPIYDTVKNTISKGEIPENAVVIPGSKPVVNNKWAQEQGLQVACAVIVKYRDNRTATSVVLEDLLR